MDDNSVYNWPPRKIDPILLEQREFEAVNLLFVLCRVPREEDEAARSVRLLQLDQVLSELFERFDFAKHGCRKKLLNLFRLVDRKEYEHVFFALRDHLFREFGILDQLMLNYLKKADDFEPEMRKSMTTLVQCEIMLSRPTFKKTSMKEMRSELEKSCVIPRKHLQGSKYKHVDSDVGRVFSEINSAIQVDLMKGIDDER